MRSNTSFNVMRLTIGAAVVSSALVVATERPAARFGPDDPVYVDDDTRLDASGAVLRELGRYADFVLNSFLSPGDPSRRPALNANTLGEVPDSSWFTNRLGPTTMSIDDIVRGPDRVTRLEVEEWIIVAAKDTGRQPGFRAINAADPTRHLYQIEFDSRSNPEMATGAEIIGTALYHAMGYNVVENYLIELDLRKVSIAPTATITTAGRTRPFTRRDLNSLLDGVARKPNGRYRALASRFADGRYLGPFRYYGTRPDDPNDKYPHEHRRELRGNRVFSAWLNHDDSRAGNSLDMLVSVEGRRHVKHYMFDFGSILGSGTGEQDHPWVGREYVVEPKPGLLTLASLGFWRRPYLRVESPARLPAAGNFTADRFEPALWKPHYPNQAFRHLEPEDGFWAARIVAAFSAEALARIVAKAEYSDPRTSAHIVDTLLRRRERVLQTWLTALNPIVNPRVEAGVLRFDNAAELAGLAESSSAYEVVWFQFDNDSGVHTPVTGPAVFERTSLPVPPEVLQADYAGVDVRTLNDSHPNWSRVVRIYFKHLGEGWLTVGIERDVRPNGHPEPGRGSTR